MLTVHLKTKSKLKETLNLSAVEEHLSDGFTVLDAIGWLFVFISETFGVRSQTDFTAVFVRINQCL